jgi:hypothetical protein
MTPGVSTPCAEVHIFTLPPGYRPAKHEVHVTLTNSQLGRIGVDGPDLGLGGGAVLIEIPTTFANAAQWVSLDGISFRDTLGTNPGGPSPTDEFQHAEESNSVGAPECTGGVMSSKGVS